ncbi:extracellular solute-binding protein [Paenibacillus filicis]|uniref:Extracellular solute-binding protein n=1 Tax=Paenibacillus gyeongsangnamensis TaxID=3388067 RepID=A0ABT4QA23_9BACL|nr:extracellular solute-binding protein [Paenibacillus filicis]MCZ8513728.1 extracellular solute-binding protein [Paenibacillus filicis]
MRGDRFHWLLACLVTAFSVAGCSAHSSDHPDGVSSKGGTDQAPSSSAAQQQVELTVYSAGGTDKDEFDKNFREPIEKKFPGLKIKYINPRDGDGSKFENLILTGTNVDLYYESIGTFFSTLSRNKAQFDLTDLIKKNNVDLTRFEPTLIDALRDNGKGQIWGLPVTTNSMSLYYNKAIFDKFGVPYLKDGMSWEELFDVASKFNRTDGGKKYVGLAISPSHSMRMNPYSVPFVDPGTGKSTFGNEKWKQILQPILAPAADPQYQSKMADLGGKLPYSGEWLKSQELAIFGVFSDWQVVSPTPVPLIGIWRLILRPRRIRGSAGSSIPCIGPSRRSRSIRMKLFRSFDIWFPTSTKWPCPSGAD